MVAPGLVANENLKKGPPPYPSMEGNSEFPFSISALSYQIFPCHFYKKKFWIKIYVVNFISEIASNILI